MKQPQQSPKQSNLQLLASILVCIFFLFVNATTSFGKISIAGFSDNLDSVKISLLTVDRGSLPYMLAGHSLLRVEGVPKGSNRVKDVVFNWGIFDLASVSFAMNVLKGDMKYRVAVWPYRVAINHYRNSERRTVWQETLHLTREQKKNILVQLNWWMLPENERYQYKIRSKNCSTIIRDIVDRALLGSIQKSTSKDLLSTTYRDHILEYFPLFPWAHFGFDLVASGELDQTMNRWNYMYLPFNLRAGLKALPDYVNDGSPQSGKLLGPSSVLIQGKEYLPPRFSMWFYSVVLMVVTVLFSVLSFGARSANFMRFTGIVAMFWGVFSAMFSAILLFAWFGTDHIFTHENANLLFFWIVDIIYIYLGFLLFFNPRKAIEADTLKSLASAVGWLHIFFLAGAMLGVAAGFIRQDISYALIYVVPHLLFLIVLIQICFHKKDRFFVGN